MFSAALLASNNGCPTPLAAFRYHPSCASGLCPPLGQQKGAERSTQPMRHFLVLVLSRKRLGHSLRSNCCFAALRCCWRRQTEGRAYICLSAASAYVCLILPHISRHSEIVFRNIVVSASLDAFCPLDTTSTRPPPVVFATHLTHEQVDLTNDHPIHSFLVHDLNRTSIHSIYFPACLPPPFVDLAPSRPSSHIPPPQWCLPRWP